MQVGRRGFFLTLAAAAIGGPAAVAALVAALKPKPGGMARMELGEDFKNPPDGWIQSANFLKLSDGTVVIEAVDFVRLTG